VRAGGGLRARRFVALAALPPTYTLGLPPLPTVPPLPWKNVSSTPCLSATAAILSCAWYWAQHAASLGWGERVSAVGGEPIASLRTCRRPWPSRCSRP